MDEAKQFRAQVRQVMGQTAIGWVSAVHTRVPVHHALAAHVQGFSGYGNCGVYIANMQERVVADHADDEVFHRTESEPEPPSDGRRGRGLGRRRVEKRHDQTWGI
jgi:hypothetical protein